MPEYDYFEMKHDYTLDHKVSHPLSVARHHFAESGPYLDDDYMLAVKLSLALAICEVDRVDYLQDVTNHMFVKTFDFVSYLDPEEHDVTAEEVEQMKKDVLYILESGKVRFKDVPVEKDDITDELYLKYYVEAIHNGR